jgi:hypothetical protein
METSYKSIVINELNHLKKYLKSSNIINKILKKFQVSLRKC